MIFLPSQSLTTFLFIPSEPDKRAYHFSFRLSRLDFIQVAFLGAPCCGTGDLGERHIVLADHIVAFGDGTWVSVTLLVVFWFEIFSLPGWNPKESCQDGYLDMSQGDRTQTSPSGLGWDFLVNLGQ